MLWYKIVINGRFKILNKLVPFTIQEIVYFKYQS